MGRPNLATKAYLEQHIQKIETKFNRAGQAAADSEFWIVRRINLPTKQFPHFFGVPFRHSTIEGAQAEANRQAARNPGEVFGVFAYAGISAKVEAPPAELAPAEVEPEMQAA